jgi:hypothetical protein
MQSCGDCTLCCKLLHIESTKSPAGKMCSECDPNGERCKIYNLRPQECRNFNCSWKLTKSVHRNSRPDQCHAIWEPIDYDTMFVTQDPDYPISDITLKQIQYFVDNKNSVALYIPGTRIVHLYISFWHTADEVWNKVIKKSKEHKWQHRVIQQT